VVLNFLLVLYCVIGFLFVGQGRCSLKRDLVSIGALVLSTCPGYPSCSADNQSHLQAFRHIYVLAVEHRSIHTVDVDSQKSVSVDILVL
jgi:anaphase-promoting complex subunit 1